MSAEEIPEAVIEPRRGVPAIWIVPALAVVLVAALAIRAWTLRGTRIEIRFDDGHGLEPGAEVRFRGITVGEVTTVALEPGLDGVRVEAALHAGAGPIAREGSRFWVVRPELGWERVAGLETLLGPRYVAVLPGDGAARRSFVGLATPPLVERSEPGDLEIVVRAPRRGALRPGAPVLYRDIPVGIVTSVGLAGDAGAVEARLHVDKPYAALVRPQTRFWAIGGVEASVGLTGFTVELESLPRLLTGGVGLATPPGAGEPVSTGHRFELADEVDDAWLAWQPLVPVGSELLPPDAVPPRPQRAALNWRGRWWQPGRRSRQGWVLQTDRGLLGPLDLLRPDDDARDATLEVAGRAVRLDAAPDVVGAGVGRLGLVQLDVPVWPWSATRPLGAPEEALAVGDGAADPLPLAAAHLEGVDGGWRVDRAVAVDEGWHGAAVVARSDGALLGVLLIEDDEVRVAGIRDVEAE